MPVDPNTLIDALRRIGNALRVGDPVAPEDLETLGGRGAINRQGPTFWQSAVKDLPDSDVADIARGQTFMETRPSWSGGSVSGVIWLCRELVDRGAPRELLDNLTRWIRGNTTNDYLPFGRVFPGAHTYSEYLALCAAQDRRIEYWEQQDRVLEAVAATERAERKARAAAGHQDKRSAKRAARIAVLEPLTIEERLAHIARDPDYLPQFYPTSIAGAAQQEVIDRLPVEVRVELARRLKAKQRGPWGLFKKRLLDTLPPLWNRDQWDASMVRYGVTFDDTADQDSETGQAQSASTDGGSRE